MIQRLTYTAADSGGNNVEYFAWKCALCQAFGTDIEEIVTDAASDTHALIHMNEPAAYHFAADALQWINDLIEKGYNPNVEEWVMGFDLPYLANLFEDHADELEKK